MCAHLVTAPKAALSKPPWRLSQVNLSHPFLGRSSPEYDSAQLRLHTCHRAPHLCDINAAFFKLVQPVWISFCFPARSFHPHGLLFFPFLKPKVRPKVRSVMARLFRSRLDCIVSSFWEHFSVTINRKVKPRFKMDD